MAITRMSVKAEANVGASLGLVKVSINSLSRKVLEDQALVCGTGWGVAWLS